MSNLHCVRLAGLLLTGLMLLSPNALCTDDSVHAFFVGKLWPGNGEAINDAVMVVRDGSIISVGARDQVEVPEACIRHELQNAVVVPGFVIAETSIGFSRDDDRTMTPEVRAVDGFDLFADYSEFVAAGVTTVQISPGRQRLMPGQGAVVKLAGEDHTKRILSHSESLRVVLSSESANVPKIYEPPVGAVSVDNPLKPTRPQLAESLAARVAGLRAVFRAADANDANSTHELDLTAIHECLKRRRIRISAGNAAEIRASLNLFAELQKIAGHDLNLVLSGPSDPGPFMERLQQIKSVGIVLKADVRPGQVSNPSVPGPSDKPKKKSWDIARELSQHGLQDAVAIRPNVDTDLHDMLFLAGLFTRGGNSTESVLRMLTTNPAKILGVDANVGVLADGHDADFVVLTGDPFAQGTLIQSTWINGTKEYSRDTRKQTTLIQAAAVHVGDGTIITSGAVVVSGKTIQAVGANVSAPQDAITRKYPGAVVVPGFIDLGTGLGFGGSVSGVKLSTKLGDRLASDDPDIAFARQGGVTTAVYATTGSPSPLVAFKLGDTPRLLGEPIGVRFTMSSNLTSGVPAMKKTLTSGKAYADAWTKYEREHKDYQQKLKEYEAALAKYEAKQKAEAAKKAAEQKKAAETKTDESESKESSDAKPAKDRKDEVKKETDGDKKDDAKPVDDSKTSSSATAKEKQSARSADSETPKPDSDAPKKPTEPKKPKTSTSMEPYRRLFAGDIPAVVQAKSVNAITAAMKLFRDEFDLKTILVGADDAWRVSELIAEKGANVSVGPTLVRRVESEVINLPQVMANAGIPFAFQTNATTGVQQLPLVVQYAVHHGLGSSDALNALTHSPAQLLDLDQHVGSLAAGRDADLVVLSGPPFELSTEVLAVMIDGEWVFERGAKK
jgi:imidazolonepropionase-like amidohydrolase